MGLATSIGKIFGAAGGGIVSAASGAFKARIDRKIREAELASAIHLKQLDNVAQGRINEAAWNARAQDKAGWRPGWFTVILSIPLILAFIPPMVMYIEDGFTALEQTPIWYRGLLGAAVASAFGMKSIKDAIMDKKYK